MPENLNDTKTLKDAIEDINKIREKRREMSNEYNKKLSWIYGIVGGLVAIAVLSIFLTPLTAPLFLVGIASGIVV